MTTYTGTNADDAWTVVQAGTFTLNGGAGVDTLYLGTSVQSDYITTTQSDGIHVDSISGASAALHATLQNMEVLAYNNGHDYVGIGGLEVAFLNGSTSAMYNKSIKNFTITPTSSGYTALAKDGSGLFNFTNIQRIQFNDQNLALDFANSGNASMVAQTLGAVLGAASIGNATYVGIGLKYLDQDSSTDPQQKFQDLMQLALTAVLGNSPTHAQVVDVLYACVLGTHPSPAQAAPFIAMLDQGTYSPASLGVMAAQTSLNNNNINLTGLIQTGLPYTGYNV
jgi:hypothetical protein